MMRVSSDVLGRIKQELATLYGVRLKGVVLYGSEARGEAEEDSDIDLLVLLDKPERLGVELKKIIATLYPIVLDTLIPIHAYPVDGVAYEAGEFALYRNAKEEGVLI